MIAVIGVLAITAVIGVTLASVTVFSAGTTTQARASVQSRAAADAGIDTVLAAMAGGTYPCTATNQSGQPAFSVAIAYASPSGTALDCTGPSVTGIPATARITSTGQAASPGMSGSTLGNTATVVADVDIVVASTPSGPSLDKAVFGDEIVMITNNSDIYGSSTSEQDGDVYSNGDVTLATQIDVHGSVTAHGNVLVPNNSRVFGKVWARGTVELTTGAQIFGDAWSAAPYAVTGWGVSLPNTATISGNVLANGSVQNAGTINGSALSTGGRISLPNAAKINASAYARGDIELQNGSRIGLDAYSSHGSITAQNTGNWIGGVARAGCTIAATGNLTVVGGAAPVQGLNGACGAPAIFPQYMNPAGSPAQGIPATVPPPTVETFPVINSTAADIATWTAATGGGWQIKDYRTTADACTVAQNDIQSWSDSTSWSAPRLVLLPKCTFHWDYKAGNKPFQLRNDLAIISHGDFESQNANTVEGRTTSGTSLTACEDGKNLGPGGAVCERRLYWIVASDTPGLCSSNDIHIKTQFDTTQVNTLMFTPCTIQVDNNLGDKTGNTITPFKGQLYAGKKVSTGSQTHIQMGNIGVPNLSTGGGTPPPVTSASVAVKARYDRAGS